MGAIIPGSRGLRAVVTGRPLLLLLAALGILVAAPQPTALGQPATPGDGTSLNSTCPWRPGGGGLRGPGRMGLGDQGFIVMMIPHHEAAIAMADLALRRAGHPELRALAQRIKTSQSQENEQMRRWYRQWYGGAVPTWVQGRGGGPGCGIAGGGMGMGRGMGMGMPGFDVSMAILKQAANFDQAFIEQMIPHHRMGVMMASMAQINAQHPELLALERRMVEVQSEEIREMARWYRQWFAAPGPR